MLEEEEYIIEEEVEVKQQQGDKNEKSKSTLSPDVEYALEDGFLNVFRDKNALFLNSSLFNNHITSSGASILFDMLNKNDSTISALFLSDNLINDECMIALGEYLQYNEHISKIILSNNNITDKGVDILSEYLIGNTTMRTIDLSNNHQITAKSVASLTNIAKMSDIINIKIGNTAISEQDMMMLNNLLDIPFDKRETPIKSKTKSAAKIS